MTRTINTNSTIVYRPLHKGEFHQYRSIWLECLRIFPDNFGPTYQEEVDNPTLKLSHVFSDSETSDFVYGAFAEGQLIGICGFIFEKMKKTKHRGSITQMFVRPEFSGQGIGGKLLKAAIEKSFADKRTEQITLTVVATNKKAIATYKKFGFKQYGLLEDCIKNESGYVADLFFMLSRKDYLTS